MGRPRKLVWNEDGKVSEEKTLEKVETPTVINKKQNVEIGEEIEPVVSRKVHKTFKEDISKQAVSVADKKKLPKITLSYYDSNDKLVINEFVCAHIRLDQDASTTLEGLPTGRKDTLHISIDAQVVKVE